MARTRIDHIGYGTQYYRAPTPLPEEWDHDLGAMGRVAGINLVQIRVQWRWNEPVEGRYRFDDVDSLFDLAEKHGRRVVFKFMMETAPDYIYARYGGMRRDMHGAPIPPGAHGAYYVGGWWPCFDNPAVVRKAEDFVRVFVRRYRTRKPLVFWNVWNEPRSRPIGECGCGHSIRRYREWLRREFGTVDALNAKFGKRWASFDTVTRKFAPLATASREICGKADSKQIMAGKRISPLATGSRKTVRRGPGRNSA